MTFRTRHRHRQRAAGVQKLVLSAAIRTDRYNDVGSTTNPKLSHTRPVMGGAAIRFWAGKSFHPPSLADAGTAIDPVPFVSVATSVSGELQRGYAAGLQLIVDLSARENRAARLRLREELLQGRIESPDPGSLIFGQ